MRTLFSLSTLLCVTLTLSGCNSQSGRQDANTPDDHAHPTHGPHGGSLIELGLHEYHGEMVLDEGAHKVTIYLLDADAKGPVSAEGEVVINATVGGEPQQYPLTPVTTDQAAPANSAFEVTDQSLVEALHDHDANPRLKVSINQKQYVGDITHDHDHDHDHDDDHGHAHGDDNHDE